MKKYITIIVLAVLTLKAAAQDTVPNPSFERWSNDTATLTGIGTKIPYLNPTGWTTVNSVTLAEGGEAGVTRSSNAYSGNYAAQLRTDSLAIASITIPGVMLLGSINIETQKITGGVPFTGRPDSLYFYGEYIPAKGKVDSGLAYVLLTDWNTKTNRRDTVGFGGILTFGLDSPYGQFNIPITYNPQYSEVPDTIQIAFSTSYSFYNPPAGSLFLIDDLSFSADTSVATGVNIIANKGFSVSCYPNPTKSNLNILISQPKSGMIIKVYDVLGRNLMNVNNEGLITTIDVSSLASGTYFYEVADKNGNLLKTEKFNVVK